MQWREGVKVAVRAGKGEGIPETERQVRWEWAKLILQDFNPKGR